MKPDLQQKIQGLIKASAILNPTEKQEWLQLLEVMSEAQAQELEKILGSSTPASRPVSMSSGPHALPPLRPPVTHTSSPTAKPKQNLGHIVNIPQAFTPATVKGAPAPHETSVHGSFAEKIDHMIHEKELTSGKKQQPVPTPTPVPVPEETHHLLVEKSSPKPPVSQPAPKPSVPPPAPVPAPAPKPVLTNIQKLAAEVVLEAEKARAEAAAPKPAAPQKPTNTPEAVLSKVIQSGQATAGFSKHALPVHEAEHSSQAKKVTISGPSDLAALSPETLQLYAYQDLMNAIKKVVHSNSYHTSLAYLEKSPLYKSYLETGLKLLEEGKNFENSKMSKDKKYLTRPQFEAFADLLAQIQVG